MNGLAVLAMQWDAAWNTRRAEERGAPFAVQQNAASFVGAECHCVLYVSFRRRDGGLDRSLSSAGIESGPGTAALGYSVFSAAMATMRFLGDLVTARLGPYRAVRNGSLLAAIGVSWALCMREPLWAMPGFGIAGCGFSIIVPLVFSSAGRVKGVSAGAGIATVSGIAYLAFIAGPPVIGFLSQVMTLRQALLVVVGCCLVSAVLSTEIKRQR